MKKVIRLFILLGIFLMVGCKEKVIDFNIGVIFPLSGATDYLLPLKKGLDLAVKEINSTNQFKNRKINLYYIDNESSIDASISAFNSLENSIHPQLYLSLTSSITKTLAKKAADAKVPIIGLITSDPKVSETNKYTFSYYQTSKEEVEAQIPVILDLNLSNIGIFYQDEDYGKSLLTELEDQCKNIDVKVTGFSYPVSKVDIAEYKPGINDYDGIFITGYKDNSQVIIKEIRSIGYDGVIMGTSLFSSHDFMQMNEADRVFLSAPAIYNPNYKVIDNFRQSFLDEYNEQIDHYSVTGYDIIYLLIGLLNDEVIINREVLVNKLSQEFIFPSLFGSIKKSSIERNIRIPLQTAIIENNQLKYLTYWYERYIF